LSAGTFAKATTRLFHELVTVRNAWDQFETLYFNPESVRLLNIAAPWFFAVTQRVLLDDVVLRVARLVDKPRKENLTIDVLLRDPALASQPDVEAELVKAIDHARRQAEKIRKHRHKTIAHLDYGTAVGTANPLPTLVNREIVEAISALEAAYQLYKQRLYDIHTDFTLRGAGDAGALVRTLAAAEGWELRQEQEDIEMLRRQMNKPG
jgi:hypothetical protein